jgi:DNA-binding transcriptional regulator YiaG
VIKVQFGVSKTRNFVNSIPESNEAQRFAEFLRAAIFSLERSRRRSVTQKQFAHEIGVSYRALQDWLNEQSTPKSASAVLRLMCAVPDQEERLRLLDVWLGDSAQTDKR